jgi:CDP-diacylglycerol---serine O-phosphatidyltransferase
MKISKAIPSAITSLNLICGSLATIFALNGEVEIAVYLIIAASIFDFLDGFAARLLKAVSEFGKQLDSLSDLISFGFAPAALLYNHIISNNILPEYFEYSVVAIVLFSALRLAKFNIDPEQSTEFKGLPTPATALFILAVVFPGGKSIVDCSAMFLNQYFIISILVLLPFFMISNIRLLSLKIKSFDIKKHFWHIILLCGTLILLILFGVQGFAFVIVLYLVLSILKRMLRF